MIENAELNACWKISPDVERTIVSQLKSFFHENNDLVRLFKIAIDLMPTDTHKIVVSADIPDENIDKGLYEIVVKRI